MLALWIPFYFISIQDFFMYKLSSGNDFKCGVCNIARYKIVDFVGTIL